MPPNLHAIRRNCVERRVFEHFLGTGRRLDFDSLVRSDERKFNPYHDPDDRRFTFKPGGGSLAPRSGTGPSRSSGVAAQPRPPVHKPTAPVTNQARPEFDPVAKRQRDIGKLSAKYESVRLEGPGTISSGRNDPGGVSYGTFQLSSNKGKVQEFVASPEADPWAAQLRGKAPTTRQFDEQWRTIAAQDPATFEAAQRAFVVRTNYSQGAGKVRRESGYDLEKASPAVRQAFFSTAVQHGPSGGGDLFAKAVQAADGKLRRTDFRYEPTLINALYDLRTEQRRNFANVNKARAAAFRRAGKDREATQRLGAANAAENDVNRRYPRERYDALLLLSGQPMSGL